MGRRAAPSSVLHSRTLAQGEFISPEQVRSGPQSAYALWAMPRLWSGRASAT